MRLIVLLTIVSFFSIPAHSSSDSSSDSSSSSFSEFPYQLGLLPTSYDARDIHYEDIIAERDGFYRNTTSTESNPAYPDSFNYEMLGVRDQGSQGSCVAMAVAAMKENMEKRDIGFNRYFSPQYIYNQRVGYPSSTGMHFRDAFGVLIDDGIVPENDYEYGSDDIITQSMRDIAVKYKIESYASINSIDALKDAIYHNGPVIVGVPVYDSGSRMWHKKSIFDTVEGYHGMAVTGYTTSGFIIRNSWGDDWNDNGYTFMINDDFSDADSWWTAIDVESGDVDSAYSNALNIILMLTLLILLIL